MKIAIRSLRILGLLYYIQGFLAFAGGAAGVFLLASSYVRAYTDADFQAWLDDSILGAGLIILAGFAGCGLLLLAAFSLVGAIGLRKLRWYPGCVATSGFQLIFTSLVTLSFIATFKQVITTNPIALVIWSALCLSFSLGALTLVLLLQPSVRAGFRTVKLAASCVLSHK